MTDRGRTTTFQPRAGIAPAATALIILELLVASQFVVSYRDGLLTHGQMEKRGLGNGLPLVWHFGVWSDGVMLSLLLAWMIWKYAHSWSPKSVILASVPALLITAALTWSYISWDIPGALVLGHALTVGGWIHTGYMWIALTTILVFYFGTPTALPRDKAIASWLLLAHVFVGTHMLLGLLSISNALPWYRDLPLASYVGWGVIALTAFSLLLANQGVEFLQRSVRHVLEWLDDLSSTREAAGYLALLDAAVPKALGALAFFLIAWRHLQAGASPLVIILLAAIAWTWFMSRLSVKQELRILKSLFLDNRIPSDLAPKSRVSIAVRVAAFTLCYLFISWYADSILIVSFCLLVVGVIDYFTRRQINEKMLVYQSDPQFAPDEGVEGRRVKARREVIGWFLFQLPHLLKEALKTFGFAIAFCLAILFLLTASQVALNGAYVMLIVTLTVNEVTVWRWRVERDHRLKSADNPSAYA